MYWYLDFLIHCCSCTFRFADLKKEILGHKDEIKACEKRGLSLASEGGLMAEAEIEEKVEKLAKDYEELIVKLEAKEGQLFSKKDLQGNSSS